MAAVAQAYPSEEALLPDGLSNHGGSGEKLNPSAVNRLLMELFMYVGRAVFVFCPVYLSGYLGFSVIWVLLCVVTVTWWKKNRQWKDTRIGTAIEFVDNESQVVNKELRSALKMASWVGSTFWGPSRQVVSPCFREGGQHRHSADFELVSYQICWHFCCCKGSGVSIVALP